MGFLLNIFREAQLRRGKLPRLRRLDKIPRAREGVFRLGVCSGGGELAWAPLHGDPPHLLWAGTTGSGKTRSMVLMGLQALDAGWDVEVIDFKGGGDYFVLYARGASVWVEPANAVNAIKEAAAHITERNRSMWDTPQYKVSAHDKRVVEWRATNFSEFEEAEAEGWKPRLILVDETASLLTDKKGIEALKSATQLGRSAGVHLVIGMQRPDANLLDGFIKHNVQARILSGPADDVAERMVHGAAVAAIADSDRDKPRPPGRGIASGFGPRPGAVLFQAFLLSPDRYLPYASHPDESAAAGGDGEGPSEGGGTDPSGSPADPQIPSVSGSVRSLRIRLLHLRLRLSALRLLFVPLRSPSEARDRALADACKLAADGVCEACGVAGAVLQADHRRPRSFGGQERKENLWALCTRCHDNKTAGETAVRTLRRRLGMVGRSGYGRPRLPRVPAYAWIGTACFITGLATDQWVMWAFLIGGLLAFGPLILQIVLFSSKHGERIGSWLNYRANKTAAEILKRRAVEDVRERRGNFLDLRARGAAAVEYGMATLRWGLIGMSGAYLAGVFVPGYLAGLI